MPRCAPRRSVARARWAWARASARSSRASAPTWSRFALRGAELAPVYDPVSHLVYAAGREHVTHVWVDGEQRIVDREAQNLAPGLDTRWQLWQTALDSNKLSSN
jgi:hypothetical protein